MVLKLTRRRMMAGFVNGAAVSVGLPLLDAFLDGNGAAFADTGAPVPVRFGTWFWGLGVNPHRWYPSAPGPNYDLKPELEVIKDHQAKINVFGNFNIPLDGAPNRPHITGGPAIRTGRVLRDENGLPGESLDVTIGDKIGTRTRFRSLDLSATGDPRNSLSGRGGGNLNPSEISPVALYKRVFGIGFKDPNSATFTPDPQTVARRSVLSGVSEQRAALVQSVGAADRQKLDQYFTSVRQLENQLDVELTKPAPLQACMTPSGAPKERPVDANIDNVFHNYKMMTDILVMALACDQTRVFNMMFSNPASALTTIGSTITHHQLTHEEAVDPDLGYQPKSTYFVNRIMEGWSYFVSALDNVKEGDRTLLDNSLVFAHSETEFAKYHTIDNIPMMTAGSAGGRMKSGIYVDGAGDPVSRVGLTLQQLMGISTGRWGTRNMETSKSIGELFA